MIHGLILDAGKQTRFDDEKPKSLQKVKGKTVLERNISILKQVVDKFSIVTTKEKEKYFSPFQDHLLIIDSGLGSGDAVLKALTFLKLSSEDKIVLIWGDSIHVAPSVFHRGLHALDNEDIIIPVSKESSPYVLFEVENYRVSKVTFSKYTGPNSSGYHDQSCFFFKVEPIQFFLQEIKFDYFDYFKNVYTIPDRKDFDFLEIFNLFGEKIKSSLFEVKTSEKSFSFNTREELENIEGKI